MMVTIDAFFKKDYVIIAFYGVFCTRHVLCVAHAAKPNPSMVNHGDVF